MKPVIAITVPLILFIGMAVILHGIIENNAYALSKELDRLSDSIRKQDWDKAKIDMESAHNTWESFRKEWMALIDHAEIDRIETSLTKIKEYIEIKNEKDCLVELAALKQSILHIPEKERLNLTNIL